MIPRFDLLVETVQANCHITDARHARNMTLCTYLLEMREYYRWENGVPLSAPLPRAAVGEWLAGRETLWSRVEGRLPAAAAGRCLVDPFDVQSANRMLVPRGFVYGAGIGRFGKPQFFSVRSSARSRGRRSHPGVAPRVRARPGADARALATARSTCGSNRRSACCGRRRHGR
jgi:hypothetical protein